jgi:hypothetical protein
MYIPADQDCFRSRSAIPAYLSSAGESRRRRYHVALGRFVEMFARVETVLPLVLSNYGKTSLVSARGAFGRRSFEDAVTELQRLGRLQDASTSERCDDLLKILAQLLLITKTRNGLLHWSDFAPHEGSQLVNDAVGACAIPSPHAGLTASPRVKQSPMSTHTLDEMWSDLQKILIHLLIWHVDRPLLDASDFTAVPGTEWRYIPRSTTAPGPATAGAGQTEPKPLRRQTSRVTRQYRRAPGSPR